MSLKQKAAMLVLAFGLMTGVTTSLASSVVAQQKCGDVETSIISGEELCGNGATGDNDNVSANDSTIWHLLLALLNIMTAGIGIAAVGGIVYGALLYTTAEDKPDQTKKAIGIITNVVIGLVAYALMFVLLNYLIPGGIFSK